MVFNDDYFQSMLKNATPPQLVHIIHTAQQEQKLRAREAEISKYSNAIYSAIREAVKAGYLVEIRTNGCCPDPDDSGPDTVIHSNNLCLTTISLEED